MERTEHFKGIDTDRGGMFRPCGEICMKKTEQPSRSREGGSVLENRFSVKRRNSCPNKGIVFRVLHTGIDMFSQNRQHLFRIKGLPGIVISEEKVLVRDPV